MDKIQIQSSNGAEGSSLSVAVFCPSAGPSCGLSADKLSQFNSVASPNFTWGDKDSGSFCSALKDVYVEVVHWRKNCFKVPLGNAGKAFVEDYLMLLLQLLL